VQPLECLQILANGHFQALLRLGNFLIAIPGIHILPNARQIAHVQLIRIPRRLAITTPVKRKPVLRRIIKILGKSGQRRQSVNQIV
jgi:hypothetical protein